MFQWDHKTEIETSQPTEHTHTWRYKEKYQFQIHANQSKARISHKYQMQKQKQDNRNLSDRNIKDIKRNVKPSQAKRWGHKADVPIFGPLYHNLNFVWCITLSELFFGKCVAACHQNQCWKWSSIFNVVQNIMPSTTRKYHPANMHKIASTSSESSNPFRISVYVC